MRRLSEITFRQAVLLAMVAVSLYPAWFVVQTALKTNVDYTLSPTGLPTHATLENLRRVVLPISKAATFTLVIVNAIWVWNELLIALVFLQDENRRTLMAGLTLFQGRYATNEPLILAGVLISILPVILVYLAGQRFFVRGMTAGIGK